MKIGAFWGAESPIAPIGKPGRMIRMWNVVDHLVSIFGTQEKVGIAAGVSQSTVSGWKEPSPGRVPSKPQRELLAYARAHGIPLAGNDFHPPDEEAAA